MPSYRFKCDGPCQHLYEVFSKKILKDFSDFEVGCTSCNGTYKQSISLRPSLPTGKVFAGDWFKKQYGFELGERDVERAEEIKDQKRLIKQVKEERAAGEC